MATNLPSCFSIEFLEQLPKFLVNFTLLKYFKSQRSYGFLITKELIFGFQILDLKDHFSASLIKKLADFVTLYFALCLILMHSNIVKTYETLLTYDLCIRNTDPHFHLLWSRVKRNIFRSQMKNAVSYMWDVTVIGIPVEKGRL